VPPPHGQAASCAAARFGTCAIRQPNTQQQGPGQEIRAAVPSTLRPAAVVAPGTSAAAAFGGWLCRFNPLRRSSSETWLTVGFRRRSFSSSSGVSSSGLSERWPSKGGQPTATTTAPRAGQQQTRAYRGAGPGAGQHNRVKHRSAGTGTPALPRPGAHRRASSRRAPAHCRIRRPAGRKPRAAPLERAEQRLLWQLPHPATARLSQAPRVAIATPISRNGIASTRRRAWKQGPVVARRCRPISCRAPQLEPGGNRLEGRGRVFSRSRGFGLPAAGRRIPAVLPTGALPSPRPARSLASMPTLAITRQIQAALGLWSFRALLQQWVVGDDKKRC